jgi:hypothetical protein
MSTSISTTSATRRSEPTDRDASSMALAVAISQESGLEPISSTTL